MLRTKLRAREILSGNYLKITAILLICLLSSLLISNIQNILSLFSKNMMAEYKSVIFFSCALTAAFASLIILPSLKLGREKWFFAKAKGNTVTLKTLFSFFKSSPFRSIGIWLSVKFLYLFWAAVMLSPAIAMTAVTVNNFKNGVNIWIGLSLAAGSFLFAVLGIAFFLIVIQRYFLVYYITVSSSVNIIKAILISSKVMSDKCLKTLKFKLSFLPWILPCFLILPIIYVWGYYKQSCACLAEGYMSFMSIRPKSIIYKV